MPDPFLRCLPYSAVRLLMLFLFVSLHPCSSFRGFTRCNARLVLGDYFFGLGDSRACQFSFALDHLQRSLLDLDFREYANPPQASRVGGISFRTLQFLIASGNVAVGRSSLGEFVRKILLQYRRLNVELAGLVRIARLIRS